MAYSLSPAAPGQHHHIQHDLQCLCPGRTDAPQGRKKGSRAVYLICDTIFNMPYQELCHLFVSLSLSIYIYKIHIYVLFFLRDIGLFPNFAFGVVAGKTLLPRCAYRPWNYFRFGLKIKNMGTHKSDVVFGLFRNISFLRIF